MVDHPEDQVCLARRVARILGPQSGAARAVARYDELRSRGWVTWVICTDGVWLVAEPPPPEPPAREVPSR